MTSLVPKILFIFINFTLGKFVGIDFHLGIGYIRAYLQQRGVASRQLICKDFITFPMLVEKILTEHISVIGFSCYDTNYYVNKLVAQQLKKSNPSLTVVFGGPTATFSPELVLTDCTSIDVCVRGEGEHIVYELLQALEHAKQLDQVAGISYRAGDKIVHNVDLAMLRANQGGAELDIFPSPYLSGMIPPVKGTEVGLLTSRGCVYRCTYCNFSAMSRHTIRYHSIKRIIAEIKAIDQATSDKKALRIFDDLFPLKKKRAKEILKAIALEKFQQLSFYCSSRADLIDEELLCLLRLAGFTGVRFGLESAVPNVLRNIKKIRKTQAVDNLEIEKEFLTKVEHNIGLARQMGFEDILVNIIVGLPSETVHDALNTLEFVQRLNITEYAHNVLQVYSGTELFDIWSHYGIRLEQSIQVLPYKTIHAYDVTQVPALPNAWQLRVADEYLRLWLEALCGANQKMFSEKNFFLGYILFMDYSTISQEVFKWLAPRISLSTTLGFVNQWNNKDPEHSASRFAEAILLTATQAQAPVNAIDCFQKKKGEMLPTFEFCGIFSEHLKNARCPFSLLPLASVESFLNDDFHLQAKTIVFTLHTKEDMLKLKEWGTDILTSDEYVVPNRLLSNSCFFLGECRWDEKECPAAELQTLVIDAEGQISPCVLGSRVGNIGDERIHLTKTINKLRETEWEKRHCHSCPVSHHCSKCLFTYPLTASEYCRVRRSNPQVSEIVRILRLVRSFQKNPELSLGRVSKMSIFLENRDFSEKHDIFPSVKRSLVLACVDEQYFIFNIDTKQVFKLGKEAFYILIALVKKVRRNDLVMLLQAKYNLNWQEAIKYFDSTILAFQRFGFLERNIEAS